jgi:hypothetical protein
MNEQDLALLRRKERAIWRSAKLRRQLSAQSQVLVAPLAQADSVWGGLVWLRRYPVYAGAVLAIALALKPRTSLATLAHGWTVWRRVARFLS